MRKKTIKILSLFLAISFAFCACGQKESNSGQKQDGETVWYLGGNNLFSQDVDVEALFEGVEDTINPSDIYNSIEYTEKMLHGAYSINSEDDLKTVREDIPFEEVEFKDSTANISILPTAVYFGSENICSSETGYKYGEYENIIDSEVAVIKFATEDKEGQTPCIYEIDGNSITFKQIEQTSGEGETFAYEFTGIEFKYDFEISGPYITFTKDGSSLKLKAFCLTEYTDSSLSLSGYSLIDSPLIDELDYFASADAWNYAVKRDGNYYDTSAYKLTDDGKITVYLADKDVNGETVEFIGQYAYIIQSSSDGFLTDFSIVLLDGEKEYYYTDSITEREARVLEEDGTDVAALEEEKIKEIAEKKSDLFDDLYKEFETQGINTTINRSTGEIAMDASVLFGGDSAVITDEGKALLNKFLAVYTSIIYNEKYSGFISKTMVEGHTAPLSGSTYESGLPLSVERADNVKAYCLSAESGVDVSKLSSTLEAVGLSNSKPIYDANGEIDLAACRRVSFRFIVNVE